MEPLVGVVVVGGQKEAEEVEAANLLVLEAVVVVVRYCCEYFCFLFLCSACFWHH